MSITEFIDKEKLEQNSRDILLTFLKQYTMPAFGVLPKTEIELLVLNMLEELGIINEEPEIYELISKLRISKTKATRLIYDRELRKSNNINLDEKVKALLKNPIIQKNKGDTFILEVENPLVSEHIKARIKKLGYISDGSFSPSLIKLKIDSVSALIESYLTDDEKKEVKKVLIKIGAPDSSFRGILKSTIKKIATKIASDSGEELVEKSSEYFSPIMDTAIVEIKEKMSGLFSDET